MLGKQSRGKRAPTFTKFRADDAALPPDALTNVRIRSYLNLQPFEQGTQPFQSVKNANPDAAFAEWR